MVDCAAYGDSVAITCADSAEDAGPVWIQVAKAGAFRGHPSGPFELGAKQFDEIVRNFKATANQRVPVDYEHVSEADPTSGSIPTKGAPAQGWIVDLENRGDTLWGLVEWRPDARAYIRDGAYRYLSPAIRFGAKDRDTGKPCGARLTSAALTNQPFLDGMMPLAASDKTETNMATEDELLDKQMRAALSLAEDCPAEEVEAKIKAMGYQAAMRLMGRRMKAGMAGRMAGDAPAPGAPPSEEEKTATAKAAELSLLLSERDKRLADLERSHKTLTDAQTKRDQADRESEVDAAIAAYGEKKGIAKENRGDMLTLLSASPDAFRRLYPPVAAHQRYMLQTIAARPGADPPQAQRPRDTLSEAKRLMSEKKISYDAALNEAARTMRDSAR
jgi:hypothetical protein